MSEFQKTLVVAAASQAVGSTLDSRLINDRMSLCLSVCLSISCVCLSVGLLLLSFKRPLLSVDVSLSVCFLQKFLLE